MKGRNKANVGQWENEKLNFSHNENIWNIVGYGYKN